jgi:hypothetical protein
MSADSPAAAASKERRSRVIAGLSALIPAGWGLFAGVRLASHGYAGSAVPLVLLLVGAGLMCEELARRMLGRRSTRAPIHWLRLVLLSLLPHAPGMHLPGSVTLSSYFCATLLLVGYVFEPPGVKKG